MNDDIVIVSGVRTPIGKFCGGGISELKAHDLGALVIREALDRAAITPSDVSEVILGQVLTAGQGQNPARQAAIRAGIPDSVPAFGVSKLCGSGYQAIFCDDAKIVVCGGQESMSQSQHSTYSRSGTKLGNCTLVDTMVCDGLTDAFHNIHMGETAEIIAEKFNISRHEQDEFAFNSQMKAKDAIESRKFEEEIVPVQSSKLARTVIDDEYPQLQCTMASLAKLRPVFRSKIGTVTAGNASGINDGAAVVILMRRLEAERRGISILGRIVGYAISGIDPTVMGLGPVSAVNKLLSKISWNKDDVDLFELNEAFASQSIAVLKELGVNTEKVNTRGGAIALGHPIGASGARVVVTLLHALKQTGGKRGIAALCIGGGMGIAMAFERI